MGFLSFLTRKSGDRPGLGIKTQAYESTVAALPPVQGNHSSPQLASSTPDPDPDPDASTPSGTYPVAGNGPNVLDKLQQAARKRSVAQLHLTQPRTPSILTDTAPSPVVPRFPELVAGRPSSAPGVKFNSRPRSVHHSFHLRPANPPVTLRPDNDFIQKQILPPIPGVSPMHRRRRSSLDSTKTRHVDLLDAQGEFRPSNFRSRLEASGARDYGEDVAERNMGINGCNVHSSASQAYYALSNNNGPNPPRPGSKTGPGPIAAAQINRDRSRHRQSSKQEAAMSLAGASDASAWHPFANFSQSFEPDSPRGQRSSIKSRDKRPDSQHHNALYIDQSQPLVEDRRKSFHALAAPRSSKDKPRPRPLSLYGSFSNFEDVDLLPPPIPPRARPRTSSAAASAANKIGTVGVESSTEENYDDPAPSPTIHGPARTMRMTSPIQYQVQNDWLAQSKSIRQEHGYPPLSLSRPSSSSSAGPRSRTHSVGGVSVKRLGEISENIPVPVRTSSLGVQSQPCVTPTTMSSGVSSNPFPRPGSQHTQTTSVDMPVLGASDKLGLPHELALGDFNIDYTSPLNYTAAEDEFSMDIPTSRRDRSIGTPREQPTANANANTTDQHVAGFTDDSDVDSFVGVSAPGRDSPAGEEGLLFDEGIYTGTAGGLPGLYDAFAMDARHTAVNRVKAVERGIYGSPKASIRPRQDSLQSRSHWGHQRDESHGLTFNEQDFSSFLALEHDFLRTAGLMGPADAASHDSRITRRSMYSYDEEDEAKVDMRTAVRLKKDLRRMDTVSTTRSRRSKKDLRPRAREEEEGNTADYEN